MKRRFATAFAMLSAVVLSGAVVAAEPIKPVATDSRIKTFIYNENDVFPLDTYYGYQCNIEFGLGEEIQTVSVGDRTSWQIVSSGRRLFVRPLETGLHTNMTIITSKRAYQFDITSGASEAKAPRDLAYVVRFYYPQEDPALGVALVDSSDLAAVDGGRGMGMAMGGASQKNMNYTLSGPDSLAPVKVFDDGKATYFKFGAGGRPSSISIVRPDGSEAPAAANQTGEYVVVSTIARQFNLRRGSDMVSVYNEAP